MRHFISLYKPYVILFILSQITLCIKAEKVSINDNLKHLEDSLCQILDTMPHDLRYIKHISTIELMLMESPRFLHYAELKEKEARNQNRMDIVCESMSDRALYYVNKLDIDSFYIWKKKMDPLALELKEYNFYFFLYNTEVDLLIEEGKIEQALLTAKQMYEEAKKYKSLDGLVAANMSIGQAMLKAKRYDEAISSLELALSLIPKKSSWSAWKKDIFSALSTASDKTGKYVQGLNYCYQQEEVIDKLREDCIGESKDKTYMLNEWAISQLSKAYFLLKLDNPEKAQAQLQKVFTTYEHLAPNVQKQYHSVLAEHKNNIGQYKAALAELDTLLAHYTYETPVNDKLEIQERRAALLAKNGLQGEAVKIYQELITAKDSINNKWHSSQLSELRTIYDTDHFKLKNNELELKNKQNQVKTILIILTISILALIICSMLYVRIFRIKKKLEYSEEQLKEEKEALKIAKEKAEEARDLAQKAERKESFFANMSHEIRTPLNAIVGFSNLLVSEEELSEEERALFIKMINQNCEQLLKLVNDVLDLSRMESGKMSFSFDTYSLTELMEEVYGTNMMLVPKHLKFLKSVPDNPVMARIDKMRMKQVLFNFINNAIKFTAEGYIRIGYKLNKEEKTVSIFVKDTGRGIPEEHQKKVFDRFYKQVDTDQGTGLGLSICSVIAEKQGGYLTLVSDIGKGSCFTIVLPYNETIN